jgi:hypothetical protein
VSGIFTAVPAAMSAFSAANKAAAATISSAGSADSEGMLAAAAAALGPIGATFLAAYAPAQVNNLAATMQVAHVHAAISCGTDASTAAICAADNV